MPPDELDLRSSKPLPLMQVVKKMYIDGFGTNPEERGGWYSKDDWLRVSQVFKRVDPGGDILDVGTGAHSSRTP